MNISRSIIQKLNSALGIEGRAHRILYNGQWIDTGCMEWSQLPSVPQIRAALSPDLADALHRSQEFLAHEYTNEPMAKLAEFFSQEPSHIQTEYAEFMANLQKATAWHFAGIQARRGATQQQAPTLAQIRALLRDEPVVAYRAGIEWEGMPSTTYSTIVVAPTTDQFDILRYERTDGANRGLGTEDVIGKLREADEKYGIDIVGAGIDGVEFTLKRNPTGKEAIALGEWLLGICPDLHEAPRRFSKGKVALWWD